jgi:hypothetical protein
MDKYKYQPEQYKFQNKGYYSGNIEDAKVIKSNPYKLPILFALLFLLICGGVYYLDHKRNFKADLKKVRSVRAKIIDKRYIPVQAGHRTTVDEQFLLVYTNAQGQTFTIDNSKLFGKAEKGDSVIVFFNFKYYNQPRFLNVKKI